MNDANKAKPAPIKKLHLKREVLVRSGLRAGGDGVQSANSDATMGNQGSGVILQPDATPEGAGGGSPPKGASKAPDVTIWNT